MENNWLNPTLSNNSFEKNPSLFWRRKNCSILEIATNWKMVRICQRLDVMMVLVSISCHHHHQLQYHHSQSQLLPYSKRSQPSYCNKLWFPKYLNFRTSSLESSLLLPTKQQFGTSLVRRAATLFVAEIRDFVTGSSKYQL